MGTVVLLIGEFGRAEIIQAVTITHVYIVTCTVYCYCYMYIAYWVSV